MMKNINEDMKKWLIVGLLVIVALVSIFGVTKTATSTKFHAKNIEALDDKRDTVLKLTAASTATSAVITLIPGDVATPIAEKMADQVSTWN